jgi:hypothetical protein
MSNSFSVIARSQRGSANARPDDRLRDEAIRTISEEKVWIASLRFAMTRVIVPAAAIFLIALNPFRGFYFWRTFPICFKPRSGAPIANASKPLRSYIIRPRENAL